MADTLKQVQADRERMQQNNKGVAESSQAALSAISGRNVLKTKTETAKLRRNEEIAGKKIAAAVEQNAAAGAVTTEKAKASAAAQLDRTKRNEVISMLNLGVYDSSFSAVLNMPESVVKSAADRKAEEIEARKAAKAAAAQAQAEYEEALENIKAMNEQKNGIDLSLTEGEQEKIKKSVAEYEENNPTVNNDAEARQQILDNADIGNIVIPWNQRNGLRSIPTTNIRTEIAKINSPDKNVRQEALKKVDEEISMRQAENEQRIKKLQRAEAYYNQLLAEKVKKKTEAEEKLSALEERYKESKAGILAIARLEYENAAEEERQTAYQEYIKTLSDAEGAVKCAAATAIAEAAKKMENAEKLDEEDRQNLEDQKIQLEQVKRAVQRELYEEDLTIEAQDILSESVKEFDEMIGYLDNAMDYADNYEEYKSDLQYQAADAKYGTMTDTEIQKRIEDLKSGLVDTGTMRSKNGTTRTASGREQIRSAEEQNRPIQKEIEELESYIEKRKEQEEQQAMIQAGAVYFADAPGGNLYEQFNYLLDTVSGQRDALDNEYAVGFAEREEFLIENAGDEASEVMEEQEAETNAHYSERDIYEDMLKNITMYYHSNLLSYSESLFTPEELNQYAGQAIKDFDAKEVYRAQRDYLYGREGVFSGDYSNFYTDVCRFTEGKYDDFTPEEGKRVLAIMNRYGMDAAFDYYAAAKEQVQLRKAKNLNTFAAGAIGMVSGITNFIENGGTMLKNAFTGSYARVSGNIMTAAHQVTMERLENMGFGGEAFRSLYMAGYSVFDMIPVVALSKIPYVGQFASSGYLYAKGIATAYNESIIGGKRADEALTYAIMSATSEVMMEKFLGGIPQLASKAGLSAKLSKGLESMAKTKGMKTAVKIASSMGSEGFEEFLQEALDPFLQKVAADLNGISDAELEDIDWDEAAKSFVVGALVGGVFDGMNSISSIRNNGMKLEEAKEMLESGAATKLISDANRLGSKRAKKIMQAYKAGKPIYEGKEGLFAYASPADIVNIKQSYKRRAARESVKVLQAEFKQMKTDKIKADRFNRLFKKVLNGSTLTTREAADIINDPEATAVFEKMLGMNITTMLPNEMAALARMAAFTENGKVNRERLELFKDTFGNIDYKALEEIIRYSDMADQKVSGIIYENPATETGLTEAELDSADVLKTLSQETGIVFYVTDQYDTGTYLAAGLMAVNKSDIGNGVFESVAHRAYYIAKTLMADHGVNLKSFLIKEAERIKGEDYVKNELEKIRRQMAVDGNDIKAGTAGDELCARMMATVLSQDAAIDKLAETDIKLAEALRKAIGSVHGHIKENSQKEPFLNEIKKKILNSDVLNEDPIFDVRKSVLTREGKLSKTIADYFDSIGGEAYREDIGKVLLNKSGAKSTVMHGFTDEKLMAVGAIKDVIEDGKIIDFQENWKNRTYDSYIIAGRGVLGGKDAVIGVVVKGYKNKGKEARFYLHEAIIIEAEQHNTIAPVNNKKSVSSRQKLLTGQPQVSPPLDNSIYNSSEKVNNKSYQVILYDVIDETDDVVDNLTRLIKESRAKQAEIDPADPLDPSDPFAQEIMKNLHINDDSPLIGTVDKFEGTAATKKAGIRIDGSVGQYGDWIREEIGRENKLKGIRREIRSYRMRNKVTTEEYTAAKEIADGSVSLNDVEWSEGIRETIVKRLAGLMEKKNEAGKKVGLVKMTGLKIKADLTEEARKDAAKMLNKKGLGGASLSVLQSSALTSFETPRRVFQEFFGFEEGASIFARWYAPVEENNRQKHLFIRDHTEKVRKTMAKKWSKEERQAAQMLIEAQLYDDTIADEKNGKSYQDAVKDIYEQKLTPGEAKKKYGIKDYDRLIQCVNAFDVKMKVQELVENNGIKTEELTETINAVREEYAVFYDAINDFLVAHGMEPIPFIRYYTPHMQLDSTLEKFKDAIRRIGTQENIGAVPVEIAGKTHTYEPNKKWNPHMKERKGTETDYDLLVTYQVYLNYFANVIFHTDDIMRMRALERAVRLEYSKEEIKERYNEAIAVSERSVEEKNEFLKKVGEIRGETTLSDKDADRQIDAYIDKLMEQENGDKTAGRLATWLQDMANIRAGKQSSFDRGWEAFLERDGLANVNQILGRYKAAKVAGSISSMAKQPLQIINAAAWIGPKYIAEAMWEDVFDRKENRMFAEEIPLLVGKKDFNPLVEGNWSKFESAIGKPMQFVDYMTSLTIAKAAYLKGLDMGIDPASAKRYANEVATKIMGSRENGEKPRAFYSKNPILSSVTVFAVEAHNSISNILFDTVAEYSQIKRTKGKKAAMKFVTKGIALYLAFAFFGNRMDDELMNQTPIPFDIIGILTQGIAAGHEMTAREFWKQTIDNVCEDLGWERIFGTERPEQDFDVSKMFSMVGEEILDDFTISSNILSTAGLSGTSIMNDIPLSLRDVFSDFSDLVKTPSWEDAGELAVDIIAALPLPLANQLKKTIQGTWVVVDGGKYKTNSKGERQLLYPVDGTGDRVKSVLFGQYSSYAAQKYYDTNEKMLTVRQTEIYDELIGNGIGNTKAYNMILEMRNIKKENGSEDTDAQREYIMGITELTDDQKYILYKYTLSDTAVYSLDNLVSSGVLKGDAMKAYIEYRSIDADETLDKEKDKATEFAYYLDNVIQSKEDRTAIKAEKAFSFGVMGAVSAEEYEAMTDAGVSYDDAYEAYFAVSELEPKEGEKSAKTAEKYAAIERLKLPEKSMQAALLAYATDADCCRMNIAFESGIDAKKFVSVKKNIDYLNEQDGKTTVSNVKITAAINQTEGLSTKQKAILWQLFTASDTAKNNPYSVLVGQEYAEKKKAYKEELEDKE